jgi:hypothetical protein
MKHLAINGRDGPGNPARAFASDGENMALTIGREKLR